MKRGILVILSVLFSFVFAPIEYVITDATVASAYAAPANKKAEQKKKEAQKKAEQKKKEAQKKAAQKQKEAQKKKKEAEKKAEQKKKEAAKKAEQNKKKAEQNQKVAEQKAEQSKKAAEKQAEQKQKDADKKVAQQKATQPTIPTAAQEAAAYQEKVAEVKRHNQRVAAYQTRDIEHRLGVWGQVGYSAIFPSAFNGFTPNAVGFVGGGGGLGYQLRYKKFLMTTGLELQTYNSLTNLAVPTQSFGVQEYESMQYQYNFDKMTDFWQTNYLQIPILMGMELPTWYWQAGVKVGINAFATSFVNSSFTTSIKDSELIDDLVNMPTHILGTSTGAMDKPAPIKLNPNVALAAEVGISLDRWLTPQVKRGRRMTAGQKFASNLHYQLAFFAEYGIMNIYNPALSKGQSNPIPADFTNMINKPVDNKDLAYTSSLATTSAAKAVLNPFLAGVKFTIMYELPRQEKKMLPIPVEPKPRMVTQVINAETGAVLANVQMTIINANTGEVVNKTSNSKGVMLSRFSKDNYRIAASKLGFLPCDTITWKHMQDLGDTIRFALVPEPKPIVYTLCGYITNKETNEQLAADVRVVASQDATMSYQGTTNEEGLFVSNMLAGDYMVYVNSVGFLPLDTMIQFEQDTLQLQLTPIKEGIKVKINHLYFATNKTIILPESESAMNDLANFLKDNPSVSIRIIGHTDNVGSDAANMRLSMGRSDAVRKDLIMRGIDASRLEATGKGETMPIATNDTEEGRAQNRRVEFEITDTQGNDIQQIYE